MKTACSSGISQWVNL